MLDFAIELLENYEARDILLTGGLIIGLLFGALSQKSAFCIRRVIVDAQAKKFGAPAVMYITALAIAIIGSQYIFHHGDIDTAGIIPLLSSYSFGAIILGGLLFGYGMVLSGGCTARHLVLASEGSARSWVVLVVLAITAYATLRGILALLRLEVEAAGQFFLLGQEGGALTVPALFNLDETQQYGLGIFIGVILLFSILSFALRHKYLSAIGFGAAIGLLVPAAWAITGVLGYDEFEPAAAQSLSFVSPLANGLQFLMTYTGSTAGFATTLLGGTLLGAFLLSLLRGKFKFRSFEKEGDILKYTQGAVFMGFGGVTALGCTIGQGLAGISVLSISSVVAMLSITAGGMFASYLQNKRQDQAASNDGQLEDTNLAEVAF